MRVSVKCRVRLPILSVAPEGTTSTGQSAELWKWARRAFSPMGEV